MIRYLSSIKLPDVTCDGLPLVVVGQAHKCDLVCQFLHYRAKDEARTVAI